MVKEYKPNYQIKFIDNYGHWYQIEGETGTLASVTAINKYAADPEKLDILMSWANKVMGEHVDKVLTEHFSALNEGLQKIKDKEVRVDNKFIHNIVNTLDIDKLIKEGKQKRKEFLSTAGDIGTRLHAAVDEFFVTGKIPILDDDIQQPFQNFMAWFNTNEYKIIMADTIVASKKYKYGGRFDALLQDKKGNLIIADFKTSSSIQSTEYKLQLAAYMNALKETYNIDNIHHGLLIRFDKVKKVFETLEVGTLDDYFQGFLAALTLKELADKNKKNNTF